MSQFSVGEKTFQVALEQLTEKVRQFFSLTPRPCDSPRAMRLAIELPDSSSIDPLSWLATQTDPTKIYWRGRQNGKELFESAAIGLADEVKIESAPLDYAAILDRVTSRLNPVDRQPRYWGGIGFHTGKDHTDSQLRRAFSAARFVLPRIELVREGGHSELAVNFILSNSDPSELLAETVAAIKNIQPPGEMATTETPTVIGREDIPNQATWCDRVEKCVTTIMTGALEKIVLARRSTFSFTRPLYPWNLLDGFRKQDSGRFLFGFQPEDGVTFVCASPELLYARDGRKINSEALAGTRPRSTDPERDTLLGEKLLNSNKERREHAFVEMQIASELNRLCSGRVKKSDRSLVKLEHVQHLLSEFTGELKDGITDADLLGALHPTPAVGGHPKERAAELIYLLEAFDRGWYAGPVGWVGHDRAEFSVGIRSGVLIENRLTLFSGAGIVEGSIPAKEWDEIENKIAGFLSLLTR